MKRIISRHFGLFARLTIVCAGLVTAAFILGSVGLASQFGLTTPPAQPVLSPLTSDLWYNGNLDTQALPNGRNFVGFSNAKVYSDFNVTSATGWQISAVYSNNLLTIAPPTNAEYEIRQSVGVGTLGTLVASGSATVVPTATGRSFGGFTEYNYRITGLTLTLPAGTYFLNVSPVGSGTGNSYLSSTLGVGAIGSPAGNNRNEFWLNGTVSAISPGQQGDFSQGVVGNVAVPCLAPSTTYVDDNWIGTPLGDDPDGGGPATNFGCNSFATVQGGVNGVATGGNVVVAAGVYNEAQVLVDRSMSVTGAGSATTTIDGGNQPLAAAGAVRIVTPVGDNGSVTFSGFTVTNPGLSPETNGTRVNIYARPLNASATTRVTNCRIQGVNAADNGFYTIQNVGSVEFDHNTITNNAFNPIVIERAIGGTNVHHNNINANFSTAYFNFTYAGTDVTSLQRVADNSIDGTSASGIFFNSSFAAVAPFTGRFTNVSITNNSITQLGTTRAGITLLNQVASGNGPAGAIENPVISGNTINGTNGAGSRGIRFSGLITNASITSNDVRNVGRAFSGEVTNSHSATGTQAHFNNFVNNSGGFVWSGVGSVDAENNWWGCNAGPGSLGCDSVSGSGSANVDSNPWIVLGVTATPSIIFTGSTSSITASMTQNSDGLTPVGTLPGIPVVFSATQGSMNPISGSIASGTVSSTFTSTSLSSGTGCATVDNQNVCTPITVTANTSTSVNSNVNPSVFGQPVTFTATVGTIPSGGTPTGVVQFKDGASNLGGPVPVTGGSAIITTSSLSTGSHTISAEYSSDSPSFQNSVGTLVGNPQTVTKADTTTALASSANPSVVGQAVIYTATISVTAPGAGARTGSVSFKENGVNIGTCGAQAVSSNSANCTIIYTTVSNHDITAVYNGDGNFNPSPASGILTQVVGKADTALTITADTPDPSVFGAPVTVNYSVLPVLPGSGTPTGNVSVTISGGSENCTGTVAAGSCVLNLTALGSRTITAIYTGDTNFNGSLDTEQHLVNKANTTTTIGSDTPDPSVVGQNYTVTVAVAPVAPGAGTPAGNVTVSDGTNTCVAILPATSCVLSSTTAGAKTLTATYSGDGNCNGSVSATESHTVNKADTTTIVQTAQNAPTYGQSTTITASLVANAPGSGTAQGNVNFLDGATPIAACQNVALNALGSATCSLNTLGAGSHTINVNYLGNANFNTSSGSAAQTVLKAPLNVTASSHTVTYGDAAPSVTSAITGFVLGETSANLGTQPSCSTTYTQGSPVSGSQYPTTCSGGVSNNYSFNYINGTVTVNKRALTVTADNKSRGYGAANPALTATLSGFIGSDNAANSTTGTAGLSTTATATSPVGNYPITATIGTLASGNYSFATFTNGTLSVTAVQLTVTANNQTRVYGAPNPTLTYSITGFVNGEGVGVLTGTPTITTSATATSAPGTYPITAAVGTLANPNYTFTTANGTLTVTQASTTTTITNAAALGNPTSAGQSYAVNWTTTPVAPATGTPTGNVTVSDGTQTCTAAVAAGTCSLTSTTSGTKTITATYAGDTNFAGSTSQPVQHNVVNGLTGNVKQFIAFGTNTNLAGVTMTLLNTATQQAVTTTTDANGNYSFSTSLGQSYTITPSGLGKAFEATSRTYTNVAGNIAGADFIAYDVPGPNAIPRSARISSQIATQGQPVTLPVLITANGAETKVAFSVEYPAGPLGVPTVTCGTGAVNCTLSVNNSLSGKVGITVTPVAPLAAGTRELVKITFPTFTNPATSAAIKFGDSPTAKDVRNAENNPIPMLYWTDGLVSFTGGTLLDGATIAGRVTTAAGQGLRNATVTLIDTAGGRRTTTTSSFGNYQFEGLELGRDYMIVVTSKRYRFASRTVNLTENLNGVDMIGLE